jgi:hypothetical protein
MQNLRPGGVRNDCAHLPGGGLNIFIALPAICYNAVSIVDPLFSDCLGKKNKECGYGRCGMKRYSVLIFVLGFITVAVSTMMAGTEKEASGDYHSRIDTFFAKIQAGNVSEAVDYIYADNPWVAKKTDEIQQVKSQMLNLSTLVGAYGSHHKLAEEVVAGRFAYLYYFVAYERQPLAFSFAFYKPKDAWMIYSFMFSDEITGEVEKQVKEKVFSK